MPRTRARLLKFVVANYLYGKAFQAASEAASRSSRAGWKIKVVPGHLLLFFSRHLQGIQASWNEGTFDLAEDAAHTLIKASSEASYKGSAGQGG